MHTPVRAEVVVDLDAIRHNVRLLAGLAAASGAATMLAVKADGYGHGAVPVARAAVEAGAGWLGACSLAEGRLALPRDGHLGLCEYAGLSASWVPNRSGLEGASAI